VLQNKDIYKRQYAGFTVGKRKRIYVNVFWFDDEANETIRTLRGIDQWWKSRPYRVWDGGDWYFQLKYDPQDGTFHDLYVNGGW
jgi:hypothetical protein